VLVVAGRTKRDAEEWPKVTHRAIGVREKRASFPPLARWTAVGEEIRR
jgi:hypothetical protein